ncbi:hypothetical protein ELI_1783 [Eubacterium callanderi]|uniref:Uncharacterized protein n=1 Tax=Eubacterium callanderi TaxID=53442 RepID=E3GDG4_9FIRM|nr:hypothetical protein ELI_1783 [Eubacterium callanderi]
MIQKYGRDLEWVADVEYSGEMLLQ